MIIDELQLFNFRNYTNLQFRPNSSVNILFGFNAQGKTNLLESIYYLATTRSHRNNKDRELLRWGESNFKVKASVLRKNTKVELEIDYQESGQKILKVGGLKQSRVPEYVGALSVVLFSPEDLVIVKGSPKERRRFLDMAITQVSKSYAYLLIQYQKVLEQRNSYLRNVRELRKNDQELGIWDEQLINLGSKIIHKRLEIIKFLALLAKDNHNQISAGKEKLEIKYLCSFNAKSNSTLSEIECAFKEKLRESRLDELTRGSTMVGPHRDDLNFYINDAEAKLYGSQGQQRTIALALKLSELEVIKREAGEYPVLLLDDVLSELDNLRRHYLIASVKQKVQTFVTTTNIEFIDNSLFNDSKTVRIDEGKLFL